MSGADTFPKLLLENATRIGGHPANREKDLGIWQTWNWSQVADEVRALACGLAALGFKRGDKLIIVGDNRPQLYWGMTAAQAIGGIPVPVYQDSVAKEMAFVVDHAEARFALVEDQEQVDKLLEIRETVPRLEQIIYNDPRGLRNYGQDFLNSYKAIQEKGREYDRANPDFYEKSVAGGKGADTSVMLYTSGTTGNPKGVVLTHENVMRTARNNQIMENLTADDEILAYLPMAWVGDHIFSFGQNHTAGFCVNCPESGATVMQDLRDIGPTYFFAPPRIFENILTSVMVRMEDAAPIKRRLFHYFMDLAQRVGPRILDGKPVAAGDRLLYALGSILVYGPLKNTLGFSRIRLAYTAGEAIGPDIFDFFRALGINLKQLYGMTEASVFITVQPDGQVDPETVGVPAPEVEVKIADNGEVLFRGPGSFQEYFKAAEATAETKDAEGWVHTGDAGLFNELGHLKIIDRAKDVGKLNDGTLVAPKYIENKLKFFPNIKEAVAFGNGRDYVAAFVNIDLVAMGNWAERHNIAYASYQELAAHPDVLEIARQHVEQVNQDLAQDPNLGGSQIKRFLILHKELDADDGELTRTRKVRRNFIAERYAELIEALYSGQEECHVETEVTFEDGRKGVIAADLKIVNAEIFPVAAELKKAS
ncbi:MAG: AMP-binding protein [Alphaproteobacteria bacterium]|nr:AMP-binding protein [Alphaproteobacteria bacterium]